MMWSISQANITVCLFFFDWTDKINFYDVRYVKSAPTDVKNPNTITSVNMLTSWPMSIQSLLHYGMITWLLRGRTAPNLNENLLFDLSYTPLCYCVDKICLQTHTCQSIPNLCHCSPCSSACLQGHILPWWHAHTDSQGKNSTSYAIAAALRMITVKPDKVVHYTAWLLFGSSAYKRDGSQYATCSRSTLVLP